MTFQSIYDKLLADPTFGEIKHRKEHMRQMYVEGMRRMAYVCTQQVYDLNEFQDLLDDEINKVAEESK